MPTKREGNDETEGDREKRARGVASDSERKYLTELLPLHDGSDNQQ